MSFALDIFKYADDNMVTNLIVAAGIGAIVCMKLHNKERRDIRIMQADVNTHTCTHDIDQASAQRCNECIDLSSSMDKTIGINERHYDYQRMSDHIQSITAAQDEAEFLTAFKPSISKFDSNDGSVTQKDYIAPVFPSIGHSDGCGIDSGHRSQCLRDRQKRKDVVSLSGIIY